MNYTELHRILTKSIIDANTGVQIAHENDVFNPDGLTSFVQPFTIISDRESMTKQGYGEVFGIYQIDVNVREGSSTGLSNSIIDKIDSFYTDSLELEIGNTRVIILNRYRSQSTTDQGWLTTPVTIEFRAKSIS
jgi:hypothetical protein